MLSGFLRAVKGIPAVTPLNGHALAPVPLVCLRPVAEVHWPCARWSVTKGGGRR